MRSFPILARRPHLSFRRVLSRPSVPDYFSPLPRGARLYLIFRPFFPDIEPRLNFTIIFHFVHFQNALNVPLLRPGHLVRRRIASRVPPGKQTVVIAGPKKKKKRLLLVCILLSLFYRVLSCVGTGPSSNTFIFDASDSHQCRHFGVAPCAPSSLLSSVSALFHAFT